MNTHGQPAPSRAPRWIGLGAIAAAVIGAAVYIGFDLGQAPDDEVLDKVIAATEPVANAPAEPVATIDAEPQAQDTPTVADQTPVQTPTFDEVRQEADGLTVIAGRAEPGSTVTVLVDGEQAAQAVADVRGSFAAVGFLDPSADGSVVTLSQGKGAESVASEEEIILAPLPETAKVAADTTTKSDDVAEDVAMTSSDDTTASDVAGAETSALSTGNPVASTDITLPDAVTPSQDAPEPPADVTQNPVPERQRVAILKSTQGGVELLQAPPVIETVALDTIGYSADGDVQLSGRAQPDAAEVRVYLNNTDVAQLAVDADGRWRGTVPDIAPGIYTMRIDEIDAAGRVSSRVETPFKREAIAVLAEASALANGPITAITVQRGDTLWAIARDRYGEGPLFVRVFEANREAIRDPDLIYPGQVFDLPE